MTNPMVHRYGKNLECNIKGSTYSSKDSTLTIPHSYGDISVCFSNCESTYDAIILFSKTIQKRMDFESDFLGKLEIYSWYYNVPKKWKDTYGNTYEVYLNSEEKFLKHYQIVSFFKEIRSIFGDTLFYTLNGHRLNIKSSVFDIEVQYSRDKNAGSFINNVASEIIKKGVSFNKNKAFAFESSEKLREGFEKMYQISYLPRDIKNQIQTAISKIPNKKEDYVNIYKELVEEEKRFYFNENVYYFKEKLQELKHGNLRSHIVPNDLKQVDQIVKSLSNLPYEESVGNVDYEKAKYVSYIMGYKAKVFVEEKDEFSFPQNKNAIIGEYFYLEEQGKSLKKFDQLFEEFFQVVGKIKDKSVNYNLER